MEHKRPGNLAFSGPLWEVLERWKSAHQAAGTQAQSLFDDWMKCRTADIEQGMRFYRDMAACHDPLAILSLQQRWLLDAANRLQAEFQELGGKVAAATRQGGADGATPRSAGKHDKDD
jgi:hypothetical protein